jgi:chromosome partitioning protein
VSKELKLRELDARLAYRVAYSDSLAQGRTVLEWQDRVAREEMVALGQVVGRILNVKRQEARK